MLISRTICLDFMHRALDEPVYFECGPGVLRARGCFYRARQFYQVHGLDCFDDLRFEVKGPTLIIKRRPFSSSSRLRSEGGETTRVRSSEENEE